MATVFDVAEYILKKCGSLTVMKLQKLVYYSQAWSLVWDERPLFRARIEAWANGPVVPALYRAHRGFYSVSRHSFDGDPSALTNSEVGTVNAVIRHYGKRDSSYLSQLTHREAPWSDARRGLSAGERGNNEITHAALAEYYSSLQ